MNIYVSTMFKGKELLYYKECNNIKQVNLHSKFCKFALKCGKRSTNVAVLGELGRYPLFIIFKTTVYSQFVSKFVILSSIIYF
jgi:hypothetical protein